MGSWTNGKTCHMRKYSTLKIFHLPRTRYLKRQFMICHLHSGNLILLIPACELQRDETIQWSGHSSAQTADTQKGLISNSTPCTTTKPKKKRKSTKENSKDRRDPLWEFWILNNSTPAPTPPGSRWHLGAFQHVAGAVVSSLAQTRLLWSHSGVTTCTATSKFRFWHLWVG